MANDAGASAPPHHADRPRNRIQVSREKRPLNFFIGLAKKFLLTEDEVELSGLGLAVTTVVTVAEILKNSGHVTISKISTSLVEMQPDGRGPLPKAKIQIWIRKAPGFSSLVRQSAEPSKGAVKDSQSAKDANASDGTVEAAEAGSTMNTQKENGDATAAEDHGAPEAVTSGSPPGNK